MDLSGWDFEPSVVLGSAVLVLAYGLAVGPLRRRFAKDAAVPPFRQLAFYLGSLCMFLALVSPLDRLGDQDLFAAHMAQHMLFTFAAPPLWVIGTPAWLLHRLVPRWLLAKFGNPLIALVTFNCVMWFWHLPGIYDLALASLPVHIAEHLMFMAAGVIGWLPVLSSRLTHEISPTFKLAYLIPSALSCTALAAIITLSPVQLYAFYGSAPLQWGLTPLEDQQLGGLTMWLPGDMIYMALIVWTFSRLFDQAAVKEEKGKL